MPSFLNVIRTCDSSFREVCQHSMFSFHVCVTFTGFCCCCGGGLDSCRCPQLLKLLLFLVKQLHYFYFRSYSFVSRYRLGVSGNIFTFLAACLAFTCIEVSLLANEIQRPEFVEVNI